MDYLDFVMEKYPDLVMEITELQLALAVSPIVTDIFLKIQRQTLGPVRRRFELPRHWPVHIS